jgi:uncharacterized spore protein YtfJ
MDEGMKSFAATSVHSQEQATQLMEKLLAVAQPGTVYSSPTSAGDYTVITANEVAVGLGFGYGMGSGFGPQEDQAVQSGGVGGGGGGGGASMARPVAVISVGPNGVEIEPIVDATKIVLAAVTAAGTMLVMLSRMCRGCRGCKA